MIEIYADGSCSGNPGPGGWGAIVISNGNRREIKGHEGKTTNNRMEMMGALKGLDSTPQGSAVTVYSDSQYLVNTMTKNWKRNKNVDLWEKLDRLVAERKVRWVWIEGHNGHPEQERAHTLASTITMSGGSGLTHFDDAGRPRMVDVTEKAVTQREATAKGAVTMSAATFQLVKQGKMAKGDVLSVAQLAGIMAAKQTPHLIPLCHPLPISSVQVDLQLDEQQPGVEITATVKTAAQTGVEMEALTAVAVAALTVYDMCKAVEKGIRIRDIRLVRKSGGKSGEIVLE